MLSKQTKGRKIKFEELRCLFSPETPDDVVQSLADGFIDQISGRREPDVFDSNKLNEEENLLQSYGEGDRFNNHKKKVNRDEQ